MFVALGVLFLLIALGNASEPGPWRDKWFNVAGFTVAGISWICGVPSMWANAKAYARNRARLDDVGFALHSVGGNDLHFRFAGVRSVAWNPRLKVRLCTIETDTATYQFDAAACPRAHHVAELIAERSGKPLQTVKP